MHRGYLRTTNKASTFSLFIQPTLFTPSTMFNASMRLTSTLSASKAHSPPNSFYCTILYQSTAQATTTTSAPKLALPLHSPLVFSPPFSFPPSRIIVTFIASCWICFVAWPAWLRASNCGLNVFRIFVLRPVGQKVTSHPPPEGMINVEVWSSKAKEYASGQMAFAAVEYPLGLQTLGSL